MLKSSLYAQLLPSPKAERSPKTLITAVRALDDKRLARWLIPSKYQKNAFAKARWQKSSGISIERLIKGGRWMLENMNRSFSINWLKSLHEEMMLMEIFWQTFKIDYLEKNDAHKISALDEKVISSGYEQYLQMIDAIDDEKEKETLKIKACVIFCRKLATIEPLKAANFSIVFLVLNQLLIENQLPMTALAIDDCLDIEIEEFVSQVKTGFNDVNHLISHGWLKQADISSTIKENPFPGFLSKDGYQKLPFSVKKILCFEKEISETLFWNQIFDEAFLPHLSSIVLYEVISQTKNYNIFFSEAFLGANDKVRHQFILSSCCISQLDLASLNLLKLKYLLSEALLTKEALIYQTTPLQKMAVLASVNVKVIDDDEMKLTAEMFAYGDYSTLQLLNSKQGRQLKSFMEETQFSETQLRQFTIEQYIFTGAFPIMGDKENMRGFGRLLKNSPDFWREYAILPLSYKSYLIENVDFINAIIEKTHVGVKEIFMLPAKRIKALEKVFVECDFHHLVLDWAIIKNSEYTVFKNLIDGYLSTKTKTLVEKFNYVDKYQVIDSSLMFINRYPRFDDDNKTEQSVVSDLEDEIDAKSDIYYRYKNAKELLSDHKGVFDVLSEETKSLLLDSVGFIDNLKRKLGVSNKEFVEIGDRKINLILSNGSSHKLLVEELDFQTIKLCKYDELVSWLTQKDYQIPDFGQYAAEERRPFF